LLTDQGTVFSWGGDFNGGQGVWSGRSNIVAIAAGLQNNIALQRDGTVFSWWGGNDENLGLSNIVAIGSGADFTLAANSDGAVVAWGRGVKSIPTGLSNVIAVAAGGAPDAHGIALHRDHSVTSWGLVDDAGQRFTPKGLTNIVAVAAGSAHGLALRQDGTVVGWGVNGFGQCTGEPSGVIEDGTKPVSIAGRILTNVVAISACGDWSLALKSDGTVVAWGRFTDGVFAVPAGLSNVVAIAAGGDCGLAITTNAAVAERFRQKK
jgi:alpha-tubulin suppressor-like RCC1 family protein